MNVKFDFKLNAHKYGIVEQIIFKIVLCGIDANDFHRSSVKQISDSLWIFSDSVKAIAIQKLVNTQILRADLLSKELCLSDGIMALIKACNTRSYTIDMPKVILSQMSEGTFLIENRQLARSILHTLLPKIDIDLWASSLSFVITKENLHHE